MTTTRLLWQGYKYFPYERVLARREAESLLGVPLYEVEDGLVAKADRLPRAKILRLTYFGGVLANSKLVVPEQTLLEVSAGSNGEKLLPGLAGCPKLRRQQTRYSSHGLHEYKGKFNPQIVRAVGNLLHLHDKDWVLDPFCGSGTTLLEAAHIGWNCVGLDVNPLAVLMSNAKLVAYKASPKLLASEAAKLCTRLEDRLSTKGVGTALREELPNGAYLAKWFSEPVLSQLAAILAEIRAIRTPRLREVFRVMLSDICREVSLQDPKDLRIRRRKDPARDYPVVPMFIQSVRAKVTSIVRARAQVSPRSARQLAILGDCRRQCFIIRDILNGSRRSGIDAAITSPPYATALPYIDTQRLSLCLLGLIDAKRIRKTESALIGHREIAESERSLLEQQLASNPSNLPTDTVRFCQRLLKLATDPDHGFRKRNVPALVYKYLVDMARMFECVATVMRKRGRYVLLVGRNRTTLQGQDVVIETPRMLASIAESRGWTVDEILELDTYQRFDIHRHNSIRQETLVMLRW